MPKFVTIDQVKNHIGVVGTTYDSVLFDIVSGIEDEILDFLPTFRELTWNETLFIPSEFHDMECYDDDIVLEHTGVDSIAMITHVESSQAIDSTAYSLKKRDGVVELKSGYFYPGRHSYEISYTVVAGSTPADISMAIINSVRRQFIIPGEDPTLPPSVRRYKEGDREIENAPSDKIVGNLTKEDRQHIISKYRDKFRHSTKRYANLRIR